MAAAVIAVGAALMVAGSGAARLLNASVASATTFTGAKFVDTTLEGCRNDGNPVISLPDGNGKFICPDNAYTTGNLGSLWAELDLVPHRLTTKLGSQDEATTTYNIIIAADYLLNGAKGYDVISAPVVNAGKSDASCQVTADAQVVTGGVTGGADSTISRTLTITQNKGTTCVFDYFQRLALGAHLYPGSSLQSYLFDSEDFSGGKKTVPLPVTKGEFPAQGLDKSMTASQDSDHIWDVKKTPTPATLAFADTCDPNAGRSAGVSIEIDWTLKPATPTGPITVITHVYATNPAARIVTVTVSDDIRSGTTVLDNAPSGPIDVPANTANVLVLTHETTVPDGMNDLNDVATATYTDKATGEPVPGDTQATASANVQASGTELNKTAVINDVESITGSDFAYSADSFSGASGAFDGGYVAGTKTTGSVSWTSNTQTGTGSVTFAKTVYVKQGSSSSGTLSDTATLTGSDGFGAQSDLQVGLSSDAQVSLTISKSISASLATGQTFKFDVTGPGNYASTQSITIAAGNTSNSVTISGLTPGSYKVHEQNPPAGWGPPEGDKTVGINLPNCSASVSFANAFQPATAKAAKVTVPAGSEAGWKLKLHGNDGSTDEAITTTGAGLTSFSKSLVDGVTYTITEEGQTGFDFTKVEGSNVTVGTSSCSFTVSYPADADKTFSCTFTNTKRGAIVVKKVTDPSNASGSFTFSGDAAGSIGDDGTITVPNLKPGTYTSTEADPTPAFDLTKIACDDGASATPSTYDVNTRKATFKLDPGETITCTFTNTQRGHVKVIKTVSGKAITTQSFTFQLRQNANTTDLGTIKETLVAETGNGGTLSFTTYLVAGQHYQLCELVMPGWNTNLSYPGSTLFVPGSVIPPALPNPNVDNSPVCVDFVAKAGETTVFAVDNTPPPGGRALTIGFWKNWASCSGSNGGGQKPVLDQVLASFPIASGQTTRGVYIGKEYVNTCAKAVALLNKSDYATGKKMASDPAYNLAAQLLGAVLNVQAGAGVCGKVVTAVNQAQALITKYNFNGTGSYTSGANKMSAADATLANQLAQRLDDFNNDRASACV